MSGVEVLAEVEQRCRRGEMTPVPVESGPLPERARRVMREIAADIEWLIGVRLAADYPLELPYSVSMAVTRGWARDQSTTSKALRTLVRLGVLRSAGTLPPQRRGLPGTKVYAPPERVEVERDEVVARTPRCSCTDPLPAPNEGELRCVRCKLRTDWTAA